MNADPVNTTLAILTIPLVLFAGYVAAKVIVATWPELKRIWKETKD